MKIVSLDIEPGRTSPASAEFVIRVKLDGPASACVVGGRVVGPRAEGRTTVEVAYPLRAVEVSDTAVSLRCVIPEPNLWTPDAPFGYAWSVEVRVNAERTDERTGTVVFPARLE
jgi:hypothetical protein